MSRDVPLVGVTTYVTDARWGPWRRSASIVPSTYDELVAEAGACPVLLPAVGGHVRARREDAAEVVRVLDALVLIGGEDVDPGAYGQPAHPEVSVTDAQRDEWERALLLEGRTADGEEAAAADGTTAPAAAEPGPAEASAPAEGAGGEPAAEAAPEAEAASAEGTASSNGTPPAAEESASESA